MAMGRTTPDVTDGDLIRAYQDGDDAAFESLYRRYRKPLFAYLNRMLPAQQALVDDLYQQTWVKVLANLPRYEDKQHFISWLLRIAHNLAVDHCRRANHAEHVESDDTIPDQRSPKPWDGMHREELRAALGQAISQLPIDQREVFLMRQRDMPFKAIAAIQETSLNTALGRMRYAILGLRKLLADWRPEGEVTP